jgi:hypothetical protein
MIRDMDAKSDNELTKRSLAMIDFDNIDDWAPRLTAVLRPYVSSSVEQTLLGADLDYIQDAQDILFKLVDRDAIIDEVIAWLRSNNIAGYHGSRLTDAEVHSIKAQGLIPLNAEARRDRLINILSSHSRWPEVADKLDVTIRDYGQGNRGGHREGQAHLTLSRTGLIKLFNHYLTHGSEFDQHVAGELLGTDGVDLLAGYGMSKVFQFAVPGDLALNAANRYFSVDDFRERGEVPNIVREFLTSWCYRLAVPDFQSASMKVDCGIVFIQTIPAAWITGIQTLNTILPGRL